MQRLRLSALALAIVATGAAITQHVSQPVFAAPELGAPTRVLDTRIGVGGPNEPLREGEVRKLFLPGELAHASSVAINLTSDQAERPGFVSAWSCKDPEPSTSILNFEPGRAIPNMVALEYSDAGLCFRTTSTVELIADVTAVLEAPDYEGVAPVRLLDTRQTTRMQPGREYPVDVTRSSGVPIDAAGGAINVTVVAGNAAGFLSVTPCDGSSGTSTVNFLPYEVVPHFTFTALDSGKLCMTTISTIDVIVDVFGWLPKASALVPVTPTRALDTRNGVGGVHGALRDGDVAKVRIAGYGGVPNDASGVTVNVVAVNGAAYGYVNVWPCGFDEPNTSTVNLWPGIVRSNQATLDLSTGGELCMRPMIVGGSKLDVVIDVVGYVRGSVVRSQPPTTTQPPASPPSTRRFETLPVGALLPSGAECAGRVRPTAEIRPANAVPNSTRGSSSNSRTDWSGFARVDGNFVGTTDEIIQWAACKWGIDEDMMRAQVVKESWWYQSANGDNGESFGLGQVRKGYHDTAFPDAITSSAYNLDYTYATWRACFEGVYTWLNQVERGRDYAAGDAWGCMGVWFSGRWYTPAAIVYLDGGETIGYGNMGVREHLSGRTWEQPDFLNG
jgi:hypothetical protein